MSHRGLQVWVYVTRIYNHYCTIFYISTIIATSDKQRLCICEVFSLSLDNSHKYYETKEFVTNIRYYTKDLPTLKIDRSLDQLSAIRDTCARKKRIGKDKMACTWHFQLICARHLCARSWSVVMRITAKGRGRKILDGSDVTTASATYPPI